MKCLIEVKGDGFCSLSRSLECGAARPSAYLRNEKAPRSYTVTKNTHIHKQ